MKITSMFYAVIATLAFALPAAAHTIVYETNLSGAAEAIPTPSPAIGTAIVTLDDDLLTMHVQVSFSGLLGTVTASHIHCCTTVAGTGTAGVATVTPTFTDFPSGVTAGTYDHVFDMTLASSYNSAFITAQGGTIVGAFNALAAGLDNGMAYLNIHTTSYPGGEVRGFLAPVPVPSAAWLLGSGLVGVLGVSRRKSVAA